jgi:hypothetical protein
LHPLESQKNWPILLPQLLFSFNDHIRIRFSTLANQGLRVFDLFVAVINLPSFHSQDNWRILLPRMLFSSNDHIRIGFSTLVY